MEESYLHIHLPFCGSISHVDILNQISSFQSFCCSFVRFLYVNLIFYELPSRSSQKGVLLSLAKDPFSWYIICSRQYLLVQVQTVIWVVHPGLNTD